MTIRSSIHRRMLDASLFLRADLLPAITTSGPTGYLALDQAVGFNNDPMSPAGTLEFDVAVSVESISGTVTFAIQLATEPTFVVPVTIASFIAATTGTTNVGITRELIVANLSGAAFIRVYATLGGTNPAVAFNAYLSPL